MPIPRKYLHDKLVLSLVSINAFLALACIIVILLRFGAGGGNGYIVQYRANLGISAFKTGDISNILALGVFSPVFAAINILLSIRMYNIRRELIVTILSLGIFVLLLAIIVSNALLVLR